MPLKYASRVLGRYCQTLRGFSLCRWQVRVPRASGSAHVDRDGVLECACSCETGAPERVRVTERLTEPGFFAQPAQKDKHRRVAAAAH